MANYTTAANVVLSVNGRQAEKMLAQLQRDAKRLENQLSKAAQAGDKATMKRLQREINQTNRLIDQLRGSASSVERTLANLDKATPRELNKALRQLKNELNGIERGSAAWDAQIAKIRSVNKEIDRVNHSMREQRSLSGRVIGWIDKWQTALVGVAAVITGLVLAGRKAVSAFAEMDQEMANVRKFTGMDEEQVKSLNDAFKKIDTRTPREELNKLAQEAGRLGKSSQEDVLGYVRAADKINVALDDLGENATLTLSKLTNIFGDEERLGTERALLSVGSVINELSQNCSASAPYIAEFTSRMGGVGAQANMTSQQIMAFAAVLDSNNQKVEASSTALSQVIVRIYQDPAKYARVAGMDVERFVALVKTDMNAALLEFLSTLGKAGKMDTLSPMFADMGENGARAISALSTLAGHIEEVKSQQLVANEAFEKATSINEEFDVQNNTVMAGLEKAKKEINELAVSLGEKLQPVMKLCLSSSTLALKSLSVIVGFLIEYKREILVLTTAIAAYQVAVNLATIKTKAKSAAVAAGVALEKIATVSTQALAVAKVLLTGNVTRARVAFQAFSATLKANPLGLVLSAITMVVGALMVFKSRTDEAKEAQKKQLEDTERQKKAMEDFKKSLTDVEAKSAEYSKNELARLDSLYRAATSETLSKEKRIEAAQRLISLYPQQFAHMSAEDIMLGRAVKNYQELAKSIREVAMAKAAAKLIEENGAKLVEAQINYEKAQANYNASTARRNQARTKLSEMSYGGSRVKDGSFKVGDVWKSSGWQEEVKNMRAHPENYQRANGSSVGGVRGAKYELYQADSAVYASRRDVVQAKEVVQTVSESIDMLMDKFGNNPIVQQMLAGGSEDASSAGGAAPAAGGGSGKSGGSHSSGSTQDRFAKEKAWRELSEAEAELSYRRGETDYIAYTERMGEIEVEFYKKQLQHQDLSQTERMQIQSKLYEAQEKFVSQWEQKNVDAEEKAYAERLAELKQFYIDGQISFETYTQKTEEEEMAHYRRLLNATVYGEKANEDAQAKLLELQFKQRQANQKRTEEAERKHRENLKKIQEQRDNATRALGGHPLGDQFKMATELGFLIQAYNREVELAGDNAKRKKEIDKAYAKSRAEIFSKYGYQEEKPDMSGYEKAVGGFAKWLESDGGKALTGSMSVVVSGMSDIFSQVTSMMQADLEIQTAAINKRYDAEISRAEGNSYKVAKLEKQKEQAIAKAKSEANRKQFVMQVIQAVAQTAQNALNAYGSAAAIPVVGHVLAPIAASMAVAAGMLQVAAIKKQQQASEAQGYSQGGFTRPGRIDEPAGVVHAGEWVASQKLVNNPRTRPLLEALDYAQRTNTIGSLSMDDISRSITAPVVLASRAASQQPVVINTPAPQVVIQESEKSTAVMKQLAERLQEPFVTVNTVTGDAGIKRAQDEYQRLISNKSPKRYK